MTPEAQRIADYCNQPELEAMLLDEQLSYFAMHEAEKVLTWEQKSKYVGKLTTMFGAGSFTDSHCATAPQRAEAFLRTLNPWKE